MPRGLFPMNSLSWKIETTILELLGYDRNIFAFALKKNL